MPRTATLGTLTKLLDQSSRPIYVVDAERRVVYCNAALAAWLDMEPSRIVDRVVEYHSEVAPDADRSAEIPLTELCPPPRALAGECCAGTVSCLARGGSLVHRQAEFVPLDLPITKTAGGMKSRRRPTGAVLVLLAGNDISAAELNATLSGDPPADELHRTIRQFRRSQVAGCAVDSLLGQCGPMRKVRAQVAAAATSGANCLVIGPRGSGRCHAARAIHYGAAPDPAAKLIPIDCSVLNDDLLRRVLDAVVSNQRVDGRHRSTLLLENLESLPETYQAQLLTLVRREALPARLVATLCSSSAARIDQAFQDALSTITIHIPRLADRLEDLPLLAQCFLESCNRGRDKQIGSVRQDALDLLSLYSWPGELDELRALIAAAHRACQSHEIVPADLPPIVQHAAQAASRSPRKGERIVLDELLATIEKEAIERAMAQARGNKTEAADLLGMTRPRLYRRLVQLGLIAEPVFDELESPEFIEQDPTENAT